MLLKLENKQKGNTMQYKIKIIGNGWVGKAMHTLFPDSLVHDPAQKLICEESADVSFICVPTPLLQNPPFGLDCSIVEEVVAKCDSPLIIIRSTVMPGTCDELERKYGKNLVFQPEFLGETPNHPMSDQKTRQWLVLGGKAQNRRKAIELYQRVYNANITIRQMSNFEAEFCKLTENRAICFKVAEMQELYDTCELAGIDYYVVRESVFNDDPRMNLWWSFIYPEKRGFNSKCIPKDVYGWASFAESVGYDPKITKAILAKNEEWLKLNKHD